MKFLVREKMLITQAKKVPIAKKVPELKITNFITNIVDPILDRARHSSEDSELHKSDSDGNDLDENDSDGNDLDENDSDGNDLDENDSDGEVSNSAGIGSGHQTQSENLTQIENQNPHESREADKDDSSQSNATTNVESPPSSDEEVSEIHSQNYDFTIAEKLIQFGKRAKREWIELYKEAKRLKVDKEEKREEFRVAEEKWLKADLKAKEWKMNKEEFGMIFKRNVPAGPQETSHQEQIQGSRSRQLPILSLLEGPQYQQRPSPSLLEGPPTASQASTIAFSSCFSPRPSSLSPASDTLPNGVSVSNSSTKRNNTPRTSTPMCYTEEKENLFKKSPSKTNPIVLPMDGIYRHVPIPLSQMSNASFNDEYR